MPKSIIPPDMIPKDTFRFETQPPSARTHYDVVVAGSGMGSLTAACLLAQKGLSVLVLEQNYLPGGCTSSYWRKGYVFEAGATTVVGLDDNMPLQYLLRQTGVSLSSLKTQPAFAQSTLSDDSDLPGILELSVPMQVYLLDGEVVTKHKNLNDWIAEAERVFGEKNQKAFWEFCFRISEFVWYTSLKQTAFPPARLSDLWECVKRVSLSQLQYAGFSLFSMKWLLQRFGLWENKRFVNYVNEQLIISAQNYAEEVNVLFGSAALCYTNFGNYYVPGGLINLVSPLVSFLEENQSELHLREEIVSVKHVENQYLTKTNKGEYTSDFFISGIPINNTIQIFEEKSIEKFRKKLMPSEKVSSAFQMGIVFRKTETNRFLYENDFCLHHQIHLPEPLPLAGSNSLFVSLSHPADRLRCGEDEIVASVSTHFHNPAAQMDFDKKALEELVLTKLAEKNFFIREEVLYFHSSSPAAWEKWTKRQWGFVGGYPQYMSIKPWQMLEARLDGKGAYLCGDTVYPGQGIPGTVLSGIIAAEKLMRDKVGGF
jgi:phytoene dehydrogenase-like protein